MLTIVLALLACGLGLLLLERGADTFTDAVADLAAHYRVSPTVVGLLTAGIEWEELGLTALALLAGSPALALGNAIGANIANSTGSFGLGLLVRPLAPAADDRRFGLVMLGVTVLVAGLLWSGPLGAGHGLLLLALLGAYLGGLIWLLTRGRVALGFAAADDDDDDDEPAAGARPWRRWLAALVGLALILAGAEVVVQAALTLAWTAGISEFLLGLTLLAVGSTLPDSVINVAGARRGLPGVVTANVLGSNITNLLGPVGLAALAAPVVADVDTRALAPPVLLVTSLLLAGLLWRPRLGRAEGLCLLLLYGLFLVLAAGRAIEP